MKKMLVFREELVQDRFDLDDYLYDSEVTRSDFIDMEPDVQDNYQVGGISILTSSWNIVFKGDDKYDFWHFLVISNDPYNHDEPCHRGAVQLFAPYKSPVFNLRAVLHSKGNYVLIYRLPKKLSELFESYLKPIMESFDGNEYTYRIPEDALGPIVTSVSKEEDD